MLKLVTFTGVDDATDIGRLIELSAQYPLIEWGVLFPMKARGRWPSHAKVVELLGSVALAPHKVNLAAHVCEPYVGLLLQGGGGIPRLLGAAFQRVQINTHGHPYLRQNGWQNALVGDPQQREYILQLDGVTAPLLIEDLLEDGEQGFFAGLHDLSHGAGVVPSSWPPPHERLRWTGYAGGLGPHNLAAQLPKIVDAAGQRDYWIDMETHVRTDGRFDLDKVEQCMRIVCRTIPATN